MLQWHRPQSLGAVLSSPLDKDPLNLMQLIMLQKPTPEN